MGLGNKKDNLAIRTARFVVDAARSVLPPFDVLCVYIFATRDGNRIRLTIYVTEDFDFGKSTGELTGYHY